MTVSLRCLEVYHMMKNVVLAVVRLWLVRGFALHVDA